jgi:ACS family hexuronate transporter-like MFS transporter
MNEARHDPRAERGKIPHLRWLIIGLIFLATVINYIDRQTVSVLKKPISDDLGLSNADYAAIQNSFLVAYAVSQMASGRLYDAIGTRLGFTLSIIVWSIAAAAHSLARTASAFRCWRFVLGFGEAGNWPGAAKAVGEWFPIRERALGMGIFNTGAAVGGALSPPIIAWLATSYGWRPTFVITGILGLGWLALWLLLYRLPEQHPWITKEERQLILEGQRESADAATPPVETWAPGWGELLRRRQTWSVVIARFLTDPIWWLYVFWLPSYFQDVRGFSLREVGWSTWFPFLAGGVGALTGGWASGHLIRRGQSVDRARKAVMIAGAVLMPAGILAVRADSPYTALVWMGVVLFGFQVWINNVQTLPSDFFPRAAVASVAGLGGTAAAISSVMFNWYTGRIVDAVGYTPVFIAAGVLGPLGLVAMLLLAGRIHRLPAPEPVRAPRT